MSGTISTTGDVVLTREELYQKVWQQPMRKLAPEFGLSDVGLAKVCKRYDIPRPPVGYWAKLSFGQKVKAKPLPALDDESMQEIHFFRRNFDDDRVGIQESEVNILIEVSERLQNPHPLVAKTRSLMKQKNPYESGLVLDKQDGLDIRVSPKLIGRALRIMDAVIKKWEELGGRVELKKRFDKVETSFILDADAVDVEFYEATKRYEKSSSKRSYWREWEYKPTGLLALNITDYGGGLRKRWADGKKQRVEDVLGRFIKCLFQWIEYKKRSRLEAECEARQRKRAEQVRKEKQEMQQAQEKRIEDLYTCTENWHKSERIRAYLSVLEDKIETGKGKPSDPEGFAKWLDWAKWYADSLDPCMPIQPRDEFKKEPINTAVSDLELTQKTREIVELLGVVDTNDLFTIEKERLDAIGCRSSWSTWSEITLVLEGLWYDVSGRRRY